jgi:hypothetical protein
VTDDRTFDDSQADGHGAAADSANHGKFALYDAAYVLGALDQDERLVYERHLAACPLCTAQVAELTGLPAVLQRADATAWIPEQLPDTLFPRLLRDVQAHRRRRRLRTVVSAGLAACLVAVLAIVGLRTWSHVQQPQALAMQPVSSAAVNVKATVTLTRGKNGTNLKVFCGQYAGSGSYPPVPGSGKRVPSELRLVVFNRSGQTQWPATWPPGNDIEISIISSWPEQFISKIAIEDDQGNALLQLVR